MKKITLLICLLSIVLSIKAAEPYNYNQNYNFNKFIKEGKWTASSSDLGYDEMILTKEATGKKDVDGNEIFKLHFKSTDYDLYLVPDNDFYPLFYRRMIKSNNKTGYRATHKDKSGMKDVGFVVLNENHIACVEIKKNAIGFKEEESTHTRIGVTVSNFSDMTGNMESKYPASSESFIRGKALGSPYKNWVALMTSEGIRQVYNPNYGKGTYMSQWKGIPKYYEHLSNYQAQQLEIAKSKKLSGVLSEFADGEYKMFGDICGIEEGKIKIKFEKTNGKVTGFSVNNSFTDGLFYDKEKFIVKHTIGANGIVTFDNNKYCFIPFDGRLLIFGTYYDGGYTGVQGVITPNQNDQFAYYLSEGKFWGVDETDHSYFCKTEMEMEYNEKLDKLMFSNYIKKYQEAVLKK